MDLRIIEMDHIVLNVADVERTVAFYCDVLGLQGERLDEFRAGKVGFPSVRISPDTLIDVMKGPAENAGRAEGRNLNHFCLVTEPTDLAALSAGLKARGVSVVTEPVSRWGAHGQAQSIYILDPDGNEVEIRHYG
jgi:catechol 2,3-dioxygenase-like lactoylglutathione lyase family enzyme